MHRNIRVCVPEAVLSMTMTSTKRDRAHKLVTFWNGDEAVWRHVLRIEEWRDLKAKRIHMFRATERSEA